jgi:hypothetical protein
MRGDLSGTGENPASAAEAWLRNNPHRLDLARIGLARPGEAPLEPADVRDVRQRLDLWTGVITGEHRLGGTPVQVTTACHPERDILAVRVASRLLTEGLAVRLAFPYGSQAWGNAADWSRPEAHTSALRETPGGFAVERVLDDTRYGVAVVLPEGAQVRADGPHEFLITSRQPVVELVVAFGPEPPADLPAYERVLEASERHWARFWSTGGALDLSGSQDERAPVLQKAPPRRRRPA